MSVPTSKFGYFPEFSGLTEAGLSPAQTYTSLKTTVTAVSGAADPGPLTADVMTGGLVNHDTGVGTNVNVTLSSAADLITKVGSVVGTSFEYIHLNNNSST